MSIPVKKLRASTAVLVILALTGCEEGLDFDLRGAGGGFSTSTAARSASTARPAPDNRGVISYPNYQVAVARRGDTVADVASRIGVDAAQLASFNGLEPGTGLRNGELIALPGRVSTGPASVPEAPGVDVTSLAGNAIDNAAETPVTPEASSTTLPPAKEPIRHRVARGETAYTIARLYNVRVRDLAQWNGLGPQFAIREGQFLLIPTSSEATSPRTSAVSQDTSSPGQGSPTPTPPSAEKPLPDEDIPAAASQTGGSSKPVADVGPQTQQAAGKLAFPVKGDIVRDYAKGRNEGINIKAAPGTSVKAAEAGTVAAITESSDGVPIIVVRHPGNLLTVYANVTDVSVKKGDQVRRGQGIARLRSGDQSFVHFEVREGFESVDPNDYLNG